MTNKGHVLLISGHGHDAVNIAPFVTLDDLQHQPQERQNQITANSILREYITKKLAHVIFDSGLQVGGEDPGLPVSHTLLAETEVKGQTTHYWANVNIIGTSAVGGIGPRIGTPERQSVDKLRNDYKELLQQNILLQTQVRAARETAAREVQRFDQLHRTLNERMKHLEEEKVKLQEENGRLLDLLGETTKTARSMVSVMASRQEQRLRMFESYPGVVEEVEGDQVVVRYEVNGDVVDQTYERGQFQGERLPNVGDHLVVDVYVTEVPRKGVDKETIEKALAENDKPDPRRKPITGPTTF
jgi:hypothetical protein